VRPWLRALVLMAGSTGLRWAASCHRVQLDHRRRLSELEAGGAQPAGDTVEGGGDRLERGEGGVVARSTERGFDAQVRCRDRPLEGCAKRPCLRDLRP
jgi:hypothetical protein